MARAVALALALLGLTAGQAAAADRYVTPTGSGVACGQLSPCSLVTGINEATAGDTVHVNGDGGEYLGISAALAAKEISVVGEGSQAPRILFIESGRLEVESGSVARLRLGRAGGTVGNLALVNSTGSRLMVESGTSNEPVVLALSTLRDSFVRQTTEGNPAVLGILDNTLRNVTAVATAPNTSAIGEFGVGNIFPPPACIFTGTMNAQNVIARGFGGDLQSKGTASCPGPIAIGHSNFRPLNVLVQGDGGAIVDLGGNQTASEPLLAADGYHQLPGSPTIDAGILTPENGPTDIDGEPRAQGAAPDIGADESVPPPPPPAVAPPPPTPPRVGTAFAARVAKVKGGKARLRLRCRGGGNCRGLVKLLVGRRLIGKARFSIAAGKVKVVRVKLNRRGKRLLRRARRHRLRAKLRGSGVKRRTVLLKQVRRRHRTR